MMLCFKLASYGVVLKRFNGVGVPAEHLSLGKMTRVNFMYNFLTGGLLRRALIARIDRRHYDPRHNFMMRRSARVVGHAAW